MTQLKITTSQILNHLFIVSAIFLLISCGSTSALISKPIPPFDTQKDIVILIDGTSNTPSDTTNIYKLWERKIDRPNLLTYYTVGVGGGPDNRIAGMMFGVGFAKDIHEAYRFICQNYNAKTEDKIYLFGFSRGSFTNQVLANLIYTAGVLDLSTIPDEDDQKKLIRKIYRAYLGDRTYTERKRFVNKVIQEWKWEHHINIKRANNVKIEVMGLFDNVEALAAPDYKEKFCAPNSNHLNQYVNIKRVIHAAALDDNRAQIFTPILSSCSNIKLKPGLSLDDVVEEVWFSGAHSDVGGGYTSDDTISYISLSWMIDEVKKYNLFKPVTITDKNINARIHDSEDNLVGALYRRRNRDIPLYLSENGVYYNEGKMKLHESVILRLERALLPYFKQSKKAPFDWFDTPPFSKCFKENENEGRTYLPDECKVIEVVRMKE